MHTPLTLNCNGTLVSLAAPKILGILNLTPDSFYDGGKYTHVAHALKQCETMLVDGADFIDVGACSSRPGAEEVSEEEELGRLLPILEKARKEFPDALFSIDTYRASVAQKALEIGAHMINDISAGEMDSEMLQTVGQFPVPYIAMHIQGTPKTMQKQPQYDDVVSDVIYFFSKKIGQCKNAGIDDVILDPGFGFGKTAHHNFKLLEQLEQFHLFHLPIVVGVSRKSMIYKTLNTSPAEALNGTTVLHTVALQKKAQLLRVHDVKEAKECVHLMEELQ